MRISREEVQQLRGFLYPLDERAPVAYQAIGPTSLLSGRLVGLFSSVRALDDLLPLARATSAALASLDSVLVSGFQSPLEKACFHHVLACGGRAVVCHGRTVDGMRLRPAWVQPMERQQLLLLSAFPEPVRRVVADSAHRRNRQVAALADALLFLHVAPGGKSEALLREVITWDKPVFALDHPANAALLHLGCRPARAETFVDDLQLAWLAGR